MIIGTTPTFILRVPESKNLNFNSAKNIYFTIRQGSIKITKTNEDISIINENTIQVSLSQEETLTFKYGLDAEIQLNWIYTNNARAATKVKTIQLSKNLIREVLQ